MNKPRFSKKAAVIAMFVLAALVLLGLAMWVYPPLLLYGMLAVTGLIGYVAVYILVLSQLRRPAPAKRVAEAQPSRDLS